MKSQAIVGLVRLSFRLVESLFGDPRHLGHRALGIVPFLVSLISYSRQERDAPATFQLSWSHLYPRLDDRVQAAGDARGHYFHQDLWAAMHIYEAAPTQHVDLGSRIDGFVAHLLTFREVQVVDIRQLTTQWPRLHFVQGDFRRLPFADNSIPSLSSLHALEHIGLGRYGDPVDPLGHIAAAGEMQRVLARHGRLYVSVPIGKERLEFNAHRVFAPEAMPRLFRALTLEAFAAVDDAGSFRQSARLDEFRDAQYSCGLYVFVKA